MFRIGMGYDVHRFTENRPLFLGGIEIPFHKGLDGHSDADVLLHAICDALLGAAGLNDIGHHFPNSDPQFKNVPSTNLLQQTLVLISKDFYILNVDATLIAEQPQIAPFIQPMKDKVSNVLNITKSQIGIKATTNEKMGFIGRNEGIAAIAVALLQLR